MRKKHLKAALSAAATTIKELSSSNTKLSQENDYLDAEIKRLTGLVQDAEFKAVYHRRLSGDLQLQLDVAKRVFGEAFTRGEAAPRKGPGRPNRKKLDKSDVNDIRHAYYGGAKQKDLARNYGVNPATISRIIRGVYH